MTWRTFAACAGLDPDLFHPLGRGNNKDVQQAKAICATCPVSGNCLLDHLTEEDGVWGGTSAHQRKRMGRK